jgi:putative SOS response-associated peptidase YedK
MPVLLRPEQFEPWLSGEAGVECLKPAPNDLLQKWPVSRRLNSSQAPGDDRSLIEEVAALSDQTLKSPSPAGQRSLF